MKLPYVMCKRRRSLMKLFLLGLLIFCTAELASADFNDLVNEITVSPSSPTSQDNIVVTVWFPGDRFGGSSTHTVEGTTVTIRINVDGVLILMHPPIPSTVSIGRLSEGDYDFIIELELPSGELLSETVAVSVGFPVSSIPSSSPLSITVLILLIAGFAVRRHITNNSGGTPNGAS